MTTQADVSSSNWSRDILLTSDVISGGLYALIQKGVHPGRNPGMEFAYGVVNSAVSRQMQWQDKNIATGKEEYLVAGVMSGMYSGLIKKHSAETALKDAGISVVSNLVGDKLTEKMGNGDKVWI